MVPAVLASIHPAIYARCRVTCCRALPFHSSVPLSRSHLNLPQLGFYSPQCSKMAPVKVIGALHLLKTVVSSQSSRDLTYWQRLSQFVLSSPSNAVFTWTSRHPTPSSPAVSLAVFQSSWLAFSHLANF